VQRPGWWRLGFGWLFMCRGYRAGDCTPTMTHAISEIPPRGDGSRRAPTACAIATAGLTHTDVLAAPAYPSSSPPLHSLSRHPSTVLLLCRSSSRAQYCVAGLPSSGKGGLQRVLCVLVFLEVGTSHSRPKKIGAFIDTQLSRTRVETTMENANVGGVRTKYGCAAKTKHGWETIIMYIEKY